MNDSRHRIDPSDIIVRSGDINPSDKVRIQVSMFNRKCSGKYLFGICNWLDVLGVDDLEIQLSDTLHRYNATWQNNATHKESYVIAREIGDEWLEKNSWTLGFCHRNFERFVITRWDYWINHSGFEQALETIRELADTDSGFAAAIDQEVDDYFSRTNRTVSEFRKNASREFIREEIAVTLTANCWDRAYELYPGPKFSPEEYLVKNHPGIPGVAGDNFVFIEVAEKT